jgi:hypothetical protein
MWHSGPANPEQSDTADLPPVDEPFGQAELAGDHRTASQRRQLDSRRCTKDHQTCNAPLAQRV